MFVASIGAPVAAIAFGIVVLRRLTEIRNLLREREETPRN
jgi:hypothetical protein